MIRIERLSIGARIKAHYGPMEVELEKISYSAWRVISVIGYVAPGQELQQVEIMLSMTHVTMSPGDSFQPTTVPFQEIVLNEDDFEEVEN